MPGLLESINLFPYKEMWRVKAQTEISHSTAGIASLLLISVLLLIAIIKMVEVFSMTTVTISTQTNIELIPPLIMLSTFQDNPNVSPFMLAFNRASSTNKQVMTASILAEYVTTLKNKDGTSSQTKQNITLQKCTASHFSKVPNISEIFVNQGMDQWTCLPLNQSYNLSGSQSVGKTFQYISVSFQCYNSDCETSNNQNVIYETYTLNSFINPSNGSKPASYYFDNKGVVFQSKTSAQYFINLDQNVIITDNSVLPYKSLSTQKSLQASDSVQAFVVSTAVPRTQIFLQSSGKSNNFNRSFLKLLDVIAFVGGLFPAFVGAFFFMDSLSKHVYEMKFGFYYFALKEANNYGFVAYLKQKIYNILTTLSFKLDWKIQEKRQELKKIINNMLDIVYLQKRIQFLENGMALILKTHQLKTLHLTFKPSLKSSDQNYKNFELRSKFMSYVGQYKRKQAQEKLKEQNKETDNILRKQREYKVSNGSQTIQKGDSRKHSSNDYSEENLKKIKGQDKIVQQSIPCTKNSPKQFLSQDSERTDKKKQGYDQMLQDITKDVGKLIHEAEHRTGDKISKKIFEGLDAQTQEKLIRMVQEGRKKGLYFEYPSLFT